MLDKRSDYAMNKRRKDTIVYISVTGPVLLTRADFDSEDEFLKWKLWSDEDYKSLEKEERSFRDNTIPLEEELYMFGAIASAEEILLRRLNEEERVRLYAKLIEQVGSCLTAKQYRRLWLYYVSGLTIEKIALAEGAAHQNVSKSISKAIKKIKKFLQKQGAKMPFFL